MSQSPARSSSATPSFVGSEASIASSWSSLRRNEHLAILLRRDLWKADSRASKCDSFNCPRKFGLFERRHHCRRCGGVFCQACSPRETALLDTANLDFHQPPRNIPISVYESAASPVVTARVCDGCWHLIHGRSKPPLITAIPSAPIDVLSSSTTSSLCSSVATPPEHSSLPRRPSFRRKPTSPLQTVSALPSPRPRTIADLLPEEANVSYGELDAYPLKYSSAICKATGGGRWTPKAVPQEFAKRLPGRKASFELELEREEAEERRQRANPIIVDGDFQYRFCRAPEPRSPSRAQYVSTF